SAETGPSGLDRLGWDSGGGLDSGCALPDPEGEHREADHDLSRHERPGRQRSQANSRGGPADSPRRSASTPSDSALGWPGGKAHRKRLRPSRSVAADSSLTAPLQDAQNSNRNDSKEANSNPSRGRSRDRAAGTAGDP